MQRKAYPHRIPGETRAAVLCEVIQAGWHCCAIRTRVSLTSLENLAIHLSLPASSLWSLTEGNLMGSHPLSAHKTIPTPDSASSPPFSGQKEDWPSCAVESYHPHYTVGSLCLKCPPWIALLGPGGPNCSPYTCWKQSPLTRKLSLLKAQDVCSEECKVWAGTLGSSPPPSAVTTAS